MKFAVSFRAALAAVWVLCACGALWAQSGASVSGSVPLSLSDVGREVHLSGVLVDKRAPRSEIALVWWVLDYGVGRIEMPVFARTLRRLGGVATELPEGTRVMVAGRGLDYRGSVQLEPTMILRESSLGSAGSLAVSSLPVVVMADATDVGTVVSFTRGTEGQPQVLTLDEGRGAVAVEIST